MTPLDKIEIVYEIKYKDFIVSLNRINAKIGWKKK